MNRVARFSITIPSEPAKKPRIFLMKCLSLSVSFSQSFMSLLRSISSGVQKTDMCCLYLAQRSSCLIGKITKRSGLSWRSGSGKRETGTGSGGLTTTGGGSASDSISFCSPTETFRGFLPGEFVRFFPFVVMLFERDL